MYLIINKFVYIIEYNLFYTEYISQTHSTFTATTRSVVRSNGCFGDSEFDLILKNDKTELTIIGDHDGYRRGCC